MELTEKQELFLQQNSLAVLATADLENQPRAIFVEINSVNKNELVITDNEMQLTKNNLLENAKVFVLAYGKNYNYCLKIIGSAEYRMSGNYFHFVQNLKTNKKHHPKAAVVIKINNVIEFK